MRIFDPKNQFGNSLLSQADTQKSSVKLEKQMAVGGGAITLTSTDISDIENWELSTARVEVDGQMVSFLPDTVRSSDGGLTIDFGTYFPNAVLVLKRTVFDGMKQEEEITIEVEIRQLMQRTMAAATAPTSRSEEEIQANVNEWKALGRKAYDSDPEGKYKNATLDTLGGYRISGTGEVVVDDCFISVDSLIDEDWQRIIVDDGVTAIKWHADLPCFRVIGTSCVLPVEYITEWTGKLPNITDASRMFEGCTGLTEWTVALPNSFTNAYYMFCYCTGLTSFSTPSGTLPNSITDASYMFQSCFSLREFTPSLAGLTNCENFDRMFDGCILNEDSIENILKTLPDRKGKAQLSIDIGGDKTMEQSAKDELRSLAQSVSTAKNWNIALSWNTPPTPTV